MARRTNKQENLMKHLNRKLRLGPLGKRTALFLLVGVMGFASLLNILGTGNMVSAAQLSSRSVTISTSQSAATNVNYAFAFALPSVAEVEGIIFEFCDTPLGTCNLPTGMDIDFGQTSIGAQDFTTDSPAFAEVGTADGDCTIDGTGDTKYCVNRTQTTDEAADGKTLTIAGVTNPTLSSGNFVTVFVRISLYDNNTFDDTNVADSQVVHDGTVAAAIVRQLTTTGRVQERLEFCVAALDDDDATPANCAAFPTDTTIDLGVIDNTGYVVSPVEPTATNGSNDDYGAAMVNTNASNGVVVTYYPEATANVLNTDTDQLRAFRVLPTDCSASAPPVLTDQCFEPADLTGGNGEAIAAGSELFGLYVACVDGSQGTTTNQTTGASNLGDPTRGATAYNNYDGEDNSLIDATPADCQSEAPSTALRFGFDQTGTPNELVESNTVVEDEMLKIRFGATAQATTPTGTYFVVTTYVATPTY